MRSPERVLNSLSEHSKDASYKFERLYRILFNEEMFYVAYQRIYAKEGNMTKGSDGQTIDNMSLKRIEKLIDTLKDETYQPQPSKRVSLTTTRDERRLLNYSLFRAYCAVTRQPGMKQVILGCPHLICRQNRINSRYTAEIPIFLLRPVYFMQQMHMNHFCHIRFYYAANIPNNTDLEEF